jgi:hypothetical protein
MPTIVTTVDFIGKYELHISEFTMPVLNEYILRMEEYLLVELFGKELYDLWNGSAAPEYTVLTAPLTFQDECGKVWQSRGIKDMLTGFIYFDYSRDRYTQQTITGPVKQDGENSGNATHVMSLLTMRYEEALISYQAIQAYIIDNPVTYPEFKGVRKETIIPYF